MLGEAKLSKQGTRWVDDILSWSAEYEGWQFISRSALHFVDVSESDTHEFWRQFLKLHACPSRLTSCSAAKYVRVSKQASKPTKDELSSTLLLVQ